jgi:hypothetical protein
MLVTWGFNGGDQHDKTDVLVHDEEGIVDERCTYFLSLGQVFLSLGQVRAQVHRIPNTFLQ